MLRHSHLQPHRLAHAPTHLRLALVAGAGRVSQLRQAAAKRGLDPNVWFHNAEYVAAEKTGQLRMSLEVLLLES